MCNSLAAELFHTGKNATDLLQVANFTALLQLVNEFEQGQVFYNQACCNLSFIAGLFETTYSKLGLWITSFDIEFATSP